MKYCPELEIQAANSSHEHYPLSLSIDAIDNRYLLSGGSDGIVALFDLDSSSSVSSSSGRPQKVKPKHTRFKHRKMISAVEWYPVDTGAFISASYDGSLYVWDTNEFTDICDLLGSSTGNTYQQGASPLVNQHLPSVYKAKFHPQNGKLIAAGLSNGTIRLCDITRGAATNTLSGHRLCVTGVCWSPIHDCLLASCSLDGNVMLWDIRKSGTQALLMQLDCRQDNTHSVLTKSVNRQTSQPAGAHTPTYSAPLNNIWKLLGNTQQLNDYKRINYSVNQTISAHANHKPVLSMCYSTCGRFLFTAGQDRVVRAWDANSGLLINSGLTADNSSTQDSKLPYDMCVIPGTKTGSEYLVVPQGNRQGDIQVNSLSYTNIHTSTHASTHSVGTASSDSNVMALGILCDNHSSNDRKDKHILTGHLDKIMSLTYRHTCQQLISASRDGLIFVWSAPSVSSHKLSRSVDRSEEEAAVVVPDFEFSNNQHRDVFSVNNSVAANKHATATAWTAEDVDVDCWSDDDDDDDNATTNVATSRFLPPIIRTYIEDLRQATRSRQQLEQRIRSSQQHNSTATQYEDNMDMDDDGYANRVIVGAATAAAGASSRQQRALNAAISSLTSSAMPASSASSSSSSSATSRHRVSAKQRAASANVASENRMVIDDDEEGNEYGGSDDSDSTSDSEDEPERSNDLENMVSRPGQRLPGDVLGLVRDIRSGEQQSTTTAPPSRERKRESSATGRTSINNNNNNKKKVSLRDQYSANKNNVMR
jgi:WD40 repeat protein